MKEMLILPIEFYTQEDFENAKTIAVDETQKILKGEIKNLLGKPKFQCSPGFECEFLDNSLLVVFRCNPNLEGGCDHNAVIHVVQKIVDSNKLNQRTVSFSWAKIDEFAGHKMFGGGAAVIKYKQEPTIITTDHFLEKNEKRIIING